MLVRLRTLWIIFRSVITVLYYSILVIISSYVSKTPRQFFNKHVQEFGRKLLSYPKVDYAVFNPSQVKFESNRHYILMSNHESLYDIPLIFVAIQGSVRMLTKRELFRVPIWGRSMKMNEFVSVDRKNREQAIKDLENAKKAMKSGILLWISPEGTRSRSGKLGAFKKGGFMLALQTGATIIPIGIRNSYAILPPKTFKFTFGVRAEVHIGKPIEASQYTIAQREQLMTDVENSIRELVGQPKALQQDNKSNESN